MNTTPVTQRAAGISLAVWVAAAAALSTARAAQAQDMKPAVRDKIKHATVMVFTAISQREKADRPLGSGSGYFINSTGLMISNNHVVDPTHGQSDEQKFQFHYRGGRLTWTAITDAGTQDEKKYEAIVLYQNESADQAILQVYSNVEENEKLETPNYLRLLPESRLRTRLKVYALGFPGGDRQRTAKDKHPPVSITEGHVIDLPRTPGGRIRRVYTDVIARPGNSGGPMVSLDGYLVGTVTLMTKPEGREDSGGANYSALVPASLSGEMIRNAFILRKIPDGSDVTPFMEMLTDADGRTNIPEFPRRKDNDVLFFEDGDRISGDVVTDSITWKSPLGDLQVSTAAIAYVMNNEEGAHLFLEGGNRIAADESGSSFEFKPIGGLATEQSFNDVRVVGFRTTDRKVEPYTGKLVIIDSDLTHLRLADVAGTVKFVTKMGPIDLKLENISRIDTNEDDEQYLVLKDGRRMTGEFGEDRFKATIAATGTPIEFGLHDVKSALVEVVQYRPNAIDGLDLASVLSSGGQEVQDLVEMLEAKEDAAGARSQIEKLIEEPSFRGRTQAEKDQFRLLEAVATMRSGDSAAAQRLFRKAKNTENVNIKAYALACGELLSRYEDFQYEGQPLSERAAFTAAGKALAWDYISKVRDVIADLLRLEGKNRGEYYRCISAAKKYEDDMRSAAVFIGTEAEDELIRLWKLAFKAAVRELGRLDREIEEKQGRGRGAGGGRGRGRGSGRAQLGAQREIDELEEQKVQTEEVARNYFLMMWDYGFRIEDPDIQQWRERKSEEPEKPGDDEGGRPEEPEEP